MHERVCHTLHRNLICALCWEPEFKHVLFLVARTDSARIEQGPICPGQLEDIDLFRAVDSEEDAK
ncbi:hypothetical protein LCGC14_0294740 [marine sediment metagenome]|uniref:Uncharacterized protein n=1 Tax=marine sediment metagenome TaxID=412755 RepID=A0A0F9WDC4_9ZZZZ